MRKRGLDHICCSPFLKVKLAPEAKLPVQLHLEGSKNE